MVVFIPVAVPIVVLNEVLTELEAISLEYDAGLGWIEACRADVLVGAGVSALPLCGFLGLLVSFQVLLNNEGLGKM